MRLATQHWPPLPAESSREPSRKPAPESLPAVTLSGSAPQGGESKHTDGAAWQHGAERQGQQAQADKLAGIMGPLKEHLASMRQRLHITELD